MTKEQMELLLGYLDNKLSLLRREHMTGRDVQYCTEQAEECRAKLLATFDPPAEEPEEVEAYWEIVVNPETRHLGHSTFDPARELAALPQVKQVLHHIQDPATRSIRLRYFGFKLEGAEPWVPDPSPRRNYGHG